MAFTPGKGTTISVTTANSTAGGYTAIAQVTSITPPAMAQGEVEVTHLGNTWRQFIPTVLDGGEVTFTIEWDPAAASHVELLNSFTTQISPYWKVAFPDTGTADAQFVGFLKGFEFGEATVDSVMTANLTIRTTSAITVST